MANSINAERLSIGYGTRTLLDEVSLGLGRGDVIGVVGRNGDGKTTLLRLLTGVEEPDSGRVIRTGRPRSAISTRPTTSDGEPVRDVIVGGHADHVWAAESHTRAVVEHLLGGVDLDAAWPPQRRRAPPGRRWPRCWWRTTTCWCWMSRPTISTSRPWPGSPTTSALAAQDRAMVVVSHDRWFLDAICTRIWEVHDGVVDSYDGGYAAYVLARAERGRQAAGMAARRKNLLRKELAWLRRGPPARTSKPKFRIDAANMLIADEPPPRDRLELQRLATRRLGKDVFDLNTSASTLRGSERTRGGSCSAT